MLLGRERKKDKKKKTTGGVDFQGSLLFVKGTIDIENVDENNIWHIRRAASAGGRYVVW